MKKLVLLITIGLVCLVGYSQTTLPLAYDSVKVVRSGRATVIASKADTSLFTTNLKAFKFNKPIFVNGVQLGSGGALDSSKLVTKYDLTTGNLQITANTIVAGVSSGVAIEAGSYDGTALYGLSQIGIPLNVKHASGNTNYFIRADDYLNNPKFTVNYNGDISTTGDISYKYRHVAASVNELTYTPNLSTNVPFKLLPGMTVIDSIGITFAGDSAKLQKAGDYRIRIYSNFSSTLNDDFKFEIRINNTTVTTSFWEGSASGAANYIPVSYEWYLHNVSANSYISFWITNTTNNNDPTIRAFKIDIDKTPE